MSEDFVSFHGAAFRKSTIACIGFDSIAHPRELFVSFKNSSTEVFILKVEEDGDADAQLASIWSLLPDFCKLGRLIVARDVVVAIVARREYAWWFVDVYVDKRSSSESSPECMRIEAFKTKEDADRAVAEYVCIVSASKTPIEA